MKKVFFILIASLIKVSCNSQTLSDFGINSANQQLIEDALDGVFFKVSQSYRLEDPNTNKFYGRKGNNEFGEITSFGVKVSGGFLIPDNIAHPWDYDENFNKYKNQYRPVRYKTTIIDSNKTVLDSIRFEDTKRLNYYVNNAKQFNGEGLTVCQAAGEQQGWLVWLIDRKEDDKLPKYVIYKRHIELKDSVSIDKPNSTYPILGAVYVVPVKVGIGNLKFELGGIVTYGEAGWTMSAVDIKKRPTEQEVENHEIERSEDELTPSDENNHSSKKNKKKNR